MEVLLAESSYIAALGAAQEVVLLSWTEGIFLKVAN